MWLGTTGLYNQSSYVTCISKKNIYFYVICSVCCREIYNNYNNYTFIIIIIINVVTISANL